MYYLPPGFWVLSGVISIHVVADHLTEVPGHLPLQLEGHPAGHAGHVVLVVEQGSDVAYVAGDGCVPQHVALAPETEERHRVLQPVWEVPQLLLDVLHGLLVGLVRGDLVGHILGVQREILELSEVDMLIQGGVNQVFQQIEILGLREEQIIFQSEPEILTFGPKNQAAVFGQISWVSPSTTVSIFSDRNVPIFILP